MFFFLTSRLRKADSFFIINLSWKIFANQKGRTLQVVESVWCGYAKSWGSHWNFVCLFYSTFSSSALHFLLSSALDLPSLHHLPPQHLFSSLCSLESWDLAELPRWPDLCTNRKKTDTPAMWPALCQLPKARIMPQLLIPLKTIITHTDWTPSLSGNNVFNLDQPVCCNVHCGLQRHKYILCLVL